KPDHRTVKLFRQRHLKVLAGLFDQVLQLCDKAGLVKLGHVAIDGTRIRANASKQKSMSYRSMKRTENQLREEVERWFREAERQDREEDGLLSTKLCLAGESESSFKSRLEHRVQLRQNVSDAVGSNS